MIRSANTHFRLFLSQAYMHRPQRHNYVKIINNLDLHRWVDVNNNLTTKHGRFNVHPRLYVIYSIVRLKSTRLNITEIF